MLRAKTHFAEWFSLDPPYPQFGPYPPNQYINGGIASFTAGELAKAALSEGREDYGVDILRRVAQKVAQDKAIYFLYTLDGKNQGADRAAGAPRRSSRRWSRDWPAFTTTGR